jgi:hypothetical protein
MRHSAIVAAATRAAFGASGTVMSPGEWEEFAALYAYARARKFPPAETLARKHFELTRQPFPVTRLTDAAQPTQVLYTTFRAVAEALEPFHEPDIEGEQQIDDVTLPPVLLQLVSDAGCTTPEDLVDMAKIGKSFMASFEIVTEKDGPFKGYTPADDPVELVTDLFEEMMEQRHQRLAAEDGRLEAEALLSEAQDELLKDKGDGNASGAEGGDHVEGDQQSDQPEDAPAGAPEAEAADPAGDAKPAGKKKRS